ncbi:succinate dehydrogenase assembly factor 2 [Paracoccus tegillarcae]|uniref:FAD assembly factor SdhE n=1 Tax=Paracoccus tegillarcae TaxID=1529068 RepID=A0A2K9ELM0_9RHOB|nr:succinate dehydrogenase assembly factor 2 [Paracoccus tegillarcae]AUH34327.1 succinate dehydrogenase assembly factor 2 [Paracoccus tegillarcae]
MLEVDDNRLRRLRMRSWRRGMKEMDLILGPFADGPLAALQGDMIAQYEALMGENDQDLYRWITARISGRDEGPEALAPLLDVIARHASDRLHG